MEIILYFATNMKFTWKAFNLLHIITLFSTFFLFLLKRINLVDFRDTKCSNYIGACRWEIFSWMQTTWCVLNPKVYEYEINIMKIMLYTFVGNFVYFWTTIIIKLIQTTTTI